MINNDGDFVLMLDERIAKLQQCRQILASTGGLSEHSNGVAKQPVIHNRKAPVMSQAVRKKIAKTQRAKWAARRSEQQEQQAQ